MNALHIRSMGDQERNNAWLSMKDGLVESRVPVYVHGADIRVCGDEQRNNPRIAPSGGDVKNGLVVAVASIDAGPGRQQQTHHFRAAGQHCVFEGGSASFGLGGIHVSSVRDEKARNFGAAGPG